MVLQLRLLFLILIYPGYIFICTQIALPRSSKMFCGYLLCISTCSPVIQCQYFTVGVRWHLGLDSYWFSIPSLALKMLVMASGVVTDCPVLLLPSACTGPVSGCIHYVRTSALDIKSVFRTDEYILSVLQHQKCERTSCLKPE